MQIKTEWMTARVAAVEALTPTVRQIDLALANRHFPFAPGSHIDVVTFIDGRAQTRSYSLLPPPRPGTMRIAVKLLAAGRGGSAFMGRLRPGAQLTVSAPDNRFPLSQATEAPLLVAGGIGITPMLGMARQLAAQGRAFRFLYAGRSRPDMAYLPQIQAICGERLAVFAGEEGRRLDLGAAIAGLDPAAELYLCGPLRMLEDARRLWAEAGRPAHALRTEIFGDSGHFAPEPFEVFAVQEGRGTTVGVHETIATALGRIGVAVLTDCERGECGLCAVKVTAYDGRIDHRDVFFSEAEKAGNARLCACVSRVVGGAGGRGRVSIDTGFRRSAAAATDGADSAAASGL
ncbi:MAG: PDR/VanB family oxidoreductase [Alphaproteobacteria bacterium]